MYVLHISLYLFRALITKLCSEVIVMVHPLRLERVTIYDIQLPCRSFDRHLIAAILLLLCQKDFLRITVCIIPPLHLERVPTYNSLFSLLIGT